MLPPTIQIIALITNGYIYAPYLDDEPLVSSLRYIISKIPKRKIDCLWEIVGNIVEMFPFKEAISNMENLEI